MTTVSWVWPYARVASLSTTAILGAAMVVGSAGGVHASGKDDSPLANIEPEELMAHVSAMSNPNIELDEIDPNVAGTLLGAASYIRDLHIQDQAKWYSAADPEAIIQGADAGAKYALGQDSTSKWAGALTGAGIGLLGSYPHVSDDLDLEHVVDEDLFAEYSGQLPKTDAEVRPEL